MSMISSTYHEDKRNHSNNTSSSNSLRSNNDISDQSLEGNSRRRFRRAFHSRRLSVSDLGKHTPWFDTKQGKATLRSSYWTVVSFVILAILGSAGLLTLTYMGVPKHDYCLILDEQFDGATLDTSVWTREVQVGTAGANGFAMTTSSSNNSYVKNGRLYIVPTLTSDNIGIAAISNGYTVNLTRDGTCTSLNATNCVAVSSSNSANLSIIPPIQSAQLTTRLSKAIRYGRVEIKATMPKGVWLWPAVRMISKDNVYGPYPSSGEVDLVVSRGNPVTSQQDQLSNTIQSGLHWGPQGPTAASLPYDGALHTYHYAQLIRKYWTSGDFVFGLDWDSKSIYTWYTTRVREIIRRDFKSTFWSLGYFSNLGVADPWIMSNATNIAPFDQAFYLSISLGVGGTTGYWTDSLEGKPWINGAVSAMSDFWNARSVWLSQWGTDPEARAFSIDYVKIWSLKEAGVACPAL